MITRRYFLKSSGLAMIAMGTAPRFLARIAAASSPVRHRTLVAVFQRGAADGLNIVIPFGERAYYDLRPSIAVAPPSRADEGSALDLDGFFGLHPAAKPLQAIYQSGQLAFVHAAGSPDNTRSHFDAQDFMETATPGTKATRDGWLNRYLQSQPDQTAGPFRAVSMTATTPRSLHGAAPVLATASLADFGIRAGANSERARNALAAMYKTSDDPALRGTAREMFEAMDFLEKLRPDDYRPAPGAEYPRAPLGNSLRQIAQLIKADAGLEVAFAEMGGWDHHANEGGAEGQLSQRLSQFAESLAAFCRDLGDRLDDVVLLTMSEFGRTARENGNRGTDHGHANVMMIIGGPVKGGKVYGRWPGLSTAQLHEGRDLALTTDFRDVFGEVLVRHMKLRNAAPVFPGFTLNNKNFQGFLA